MARELVIALSPYHLATREAPAMLALILGDHVVTLLPQPAAGTSREEVKKAVQSSPRYLRLMESWRWSGPLWSEGIIASGFDDEEAYQELAGVYASIASEQGLAPLRVLTRGAEQRATESAEKSLDFIAADLLRGGPDPGINIPISAALDRFAVRHRMSVARAGATSLAQKAEQRLGRRILSIAIPILLRAGGGRVLLLRNDLSEELHALRLALAAVLQPIEAGKQPSTTDLARAVERVEKAAAAYTRAFEKWAKEGARGDDENAERITSGYVSITVMVVPEDVVLRSSRAAIRSIGGGRSADMDEPHGQLGTLVVREMNVRPER